MLYSCRWCPDAYCEDCLDWDKTTLLGDQLDEYELLGYQKSSTAYYIVCTSCNDGMEGNELLKDSFDEQIKLYHEELKVAHQQVARDVEMVVKDAASVVQNDSDSDTEIVEVVRPHVFRSKRFDGEDSRRSSTAPSLTDTSTCVTGSSVSTPGGTGSFFANTSKRGSAKRRAAQMDNGYFEEEVRSVKSKLRDESDSGSLYG
jgi:SWI/SNF-related matrix-associated actin-dependent regulator of chromatin subfamily A member 5